MSELAVEAVVEGLGAAGSAASAAAAGAEAAVEGGELIGAGAEAVAPVVEAPAGAAAADAGELVSGAAEEGEFGGLEDGAADAELETTAATGDDSDLFGEEDGAEVDPERDEVKKARRRVEDAIEGQGAEADSAGAGAGSGMDGGDIPTGGNGGSGGDGGDGEVDPAGEADDGNGEEPAGDELVDAELVDDGEEAAAVAEDERIAADDSIQDAEIVDEDADAAVDPDVEAEPDADAALDADPSSEAGQDAENGGDTEADPDADLEDDPDVEPDAEEGPDNEDDPDADNEAESSAEADPDEEAGTEDDPDVEADPDAAKDPEPEDDPDADPDSVEDPDSEDDPDLEQDPDEEADPGTEDDPDAEQDPDVEEDPEGEDGTDSEEDPDAEPDAEEGPDNEDDPDADPDAADGDEDPDANADPDSGDNSDEDADPDAENDPDGDDEGDNGDIDDGIDDPENVRERLATLENDFNTGLDELSALVAQREALAAENPFSDELRVLDDSINAVNERLQGVQHEFQEQRFVADMDQLWEYIGLRDALDPADPMRDYYDGVIGEMRGGLTELHQSLHEYDLRQLNSPAPEFGPGRDHSVTPNELLGLHPRELHQVRGAVEDKLNELYPDRATDPTDWSRAGAQPFEEYLGHIDQLLAQREAYLATMNGVERAAYRAHEAASGMGRAAAQGIVRRLHDRTTGNLEVLQDRIGEMHPVHRPDHAAEHAQRVLDQSTQRRANLRQTNSLFRQVRGAVRNYADSRGLNENGRSVRLMEAEEKMEARRAEMLKQNPAAPDKIGNISIDRAIRHQTRRRGGAGRHSESGGSGGGSADKPAASKGNGAARAVRAAANQVSKRREHKQHKAHRKELEKKIEQIKKAHPVKYYLNPLLQIIGLHHKELASHQANLDVARSNEWRTSIPGQAVGALGNAVVSKVLG